MDHHLKERDHAEKVHRRVSPRKAKHNWGEEWPGRHPFQWRKYFTEAGDILTYHISIAVMNGREFHNSADIVISVSKQELLDDNVESLAWGLRRAKREVWEKARRMQWDSLRRENRLRFKHLE
jgi:hypothetical protein